RGRGSREGSDADRAVPHSGGAGDLGRPGDRRPHGCHPDDGPYGEGARVACRGARRTRGRSVPARAIGGRAGGARGGATAVLRGTHPRARKIVFLIGAPSIPHPAPRALTAVALPRAAARTST